MSVRVNPWAGTRRVAVETPSEIEMERNGRYRRAVRRVRKIEAGSVVEPGYFTVLALLNALETGYQGTAGPTA